MKSLAILYVAATFFAAQAVNAQSLFERMAADECKVGCLSTHRGDRKEAERFCSYVCWCAVTEKPVKGRRTTAEEDLAKCAAQYNAMADDKKLSKQEIVRVGGVFAAGEAGADMMKVRNHMRDSKLNEAPVLVCVYEGVGFQFWHETVPIKRAQLLEISKLHPLRKLGDLALKACPKTLFHAEEQSRARE